MLFGKLADDGVSSEMLQALSKNMKIGVGDGYQQVLDKIDLSGVSPEIRQKLIDGINEKQLEDKSPHPASSMGQQPSSTQSASLEQSMYARACK